MRDKITYTEQALREAVKDKPILWDYTLPDHFKKDLRTKAWVEIAALFEGDIHPVFCEKTFKRLKDNRRKRKLRMKGKSGARGGGPAENFQADDMDWLDEVGRDMSNRRESNLAVRSRPGLDDGDEDDDDEDDDDEDDGDDDALEDNPCSIRLPGEPQSRNCCEDVHEAHERRVAELDLRRAPPSPRTTTAAPSGPDASPPRERRESSPVGSVASWESTQSLAVSRTRRHIRPPSRFSPSSPRNGRRSRDASFASNASFQSTPESRRGGRLRRNRGPRFVAVDLPEQELTTIHEQETVVAGSAGSDPQNSQPVATSSPGPVVLHQQVEALVHHDGDEPPTSRPPQSVRHEWDPASDPARGPRPQMRLVPQTSPAVQVHPASPATGPLFSPSVRREVQEVRDRTDATPVSARRRHRNRRLSQHWTSPPLRANGGRGRGREAAGQGRQAGSPPARRRAHARRLRNEERDREQREIQLAHERRREVMRDNIRRQHEAAQQRQPRQQPDQAQGLMAAEGADTAILKQFLTEKDRDVYGNFGETIASLLRRVPAAVSGKLMSEVFVYVNKVCHYSKEELDNFLNEVSSLQ